MGLGIMKRLPRGLAIPILRTRSALETALVRHAPYYQKFGPPPLGYASHNRTTAVSLQGRYIYYRVPKAANSTIIATLAEMEGRQGAGIPAEGATMADVAEARASFDWPSSLSRQDVAALADFYRFAVVRNPFTRFVSIYRAVRRPTSNGAFLRHVRKQMGKGVEIGPTDFLDYLEDGGIMHNRHWSRQSDILYVPRDQLDFVGKVERLDTDLDRITMRLFGRPADMRKVAPFAAENRAAFDTVMQPHIADRIRTLYARDFENFGYSTDESRAFLPE